MQLKTTPEALINLHNTLSNSIRKHLTPTPRLSLSEWSNANRRLSGDNSSEPGPFRWQRVPYMREMLDVAGDTRTERVVILSSARVGKTTLLENVAAFYIAHDPAPIMFMFPELTTAKQFSAINLDPMIRDTPALKGKIKEHRSRDSGNTQLQKRFPGGSLTLVGSNSPSALRGKNIRLLLLDEVDGYTKSAGREGDPVNLAVTRTTNFWNRKIILTSTPTVKGQSRIEQEFKESDQRYYHIPCPHCEEFDKLTWERVRWETDPDTHIADTSTTYCVCLKCGGMIYDSDKEGLLLKGQWIAENPSSKIAGFHINALYSPFPNSTWPKLVEQFLVAKKNPETFKTFVNTVWGQLWNEDGEKVELHMLATRVEKYPAEVPDGIGLLVCAVDVQANRLEAYVYGFGAGEESWYVDSLIVDQDPGRDEAWAEIADYMRQGFTTAKGAKMPITITCIDHGHQSDRVERFVNKQRAEGMRIIMVKGATGHDAPLVKRSKKLYSVGGNTAKDLIFSRWKIPKPGPGFIHLPDTIEPHVLEHFLAEERGEHYEKGVKYYVWRNPKKNRNEALDCFVYSLAGLRVLGVGTVHSLGKLADYWRNAEGEAEPTAIDSDAISTPEDIPEIPVPPTPLPIPRRFSAPKRQNDWLKGWTAGF